MSRLGDVLRAMATSVNSALNNAGITTPNAVGIGWPNYEDLTKIITAGESQTTLYTDNSGTRNVTRWFPKWMVQTPLSVLLEASVTAGTITFSGTVTAGLNVHTLVGAPLQVCLVQTSAADTLSTVATKVAAAINALNLSGISASATANAVTVTGSPDLKCNIGGSTTLAQQVLRVKRLVQVSIWTPDPNLREAMEGAIVSSVGTIAAPRIPLADGTNFWCRYEGNAWSDEHQTDFSMYISHLKYMIEYGEFATTTATQIGAFKETWTIQGNTLPPIIEG